MPALCTLESQNTKDAGDLPISNSNRDNRKAMRLNVFSRYKPTISMDRNSVAGLVFNNSICR